MQIMYSAGSHMHRRINGNIWNNNNSSNDNNTDMQVKALEIHSKHRGLIKPPPLVLRALEAPICIN